MEKETTENTFSVIINKMDKTHHVETLYFTLLHAPEFG